MFVLIIELDCFAEFCGENLCIFGKTNTTVGVFFHIKYISPVLEAFDIRVQLNE